MPYVFGKSTKEPWKDGSYVARFLDFAEERSRFGGMQLKATFQVTRGEFADRKVSTWASLDYEGEPITPSDSNKLGRLLQHITGSDLAAGEAVELEDFLEREYELTISVTEKGSGRIDDLKLLAEDEESDQSNGKSSRSKAASRRAESRRDEARRQSVEGGGDDDELPF